MRALPWKGTIIIRSGGSIWIKTNKSCQQIRCRKKLSSSAILCMIIQNCHPSFRPKNVNTARVYLHLSHQRWQKHNIVAKADKMNQLTNVVQCQRSNSQITFVIQCKGQIFNVQIGTNFFMYLLFVDCSKSENMLSYCLGASLCFFSWEVE